MRKILAACCFVLLAGIAAYAAPFPAVSTDVGVCDPNAPSHCIAPDASGNVPITGTITASLGGFTPSASGARMTPLSVTTADSSGNLPTGAVSVVSNVGSNPMYCNVNGVAATTSDQLIASNSWFAFTIPAAVTTLHCIATGGTTTANGVGGAGLATGAGGGASGGGGGGGAVFGPTAVGSANANPPVVIGGTATGAAGQNVEGVAVKPASTASVATDLSLVTNESPNSQLSTTTGTTSDTAYNGSGNSTLSAALRGIYTILSTINTNIQAAISAGTNYIGQVGAWVAPTSYVSGTTSAMTGTTSTQLLAAVTSKKLYVLSISCVNSHATVGTFVTVQDGSGGAALATLAAASVFGGDEKTSVGPLFSTTSGNGLFVADVTTGANVICNASGFAQ